MYYDYFGLKQPPFKITPDTSMFFPGGNRGAILDALIYTILNGEGIIKVVGEVGSGKTMLCRMLERELPDFVEIVYIANPSLSPEHILHAIAFDLDLPVQTSTTRLEVMNKLQEYLLKKHSAGQHVVVFIEEAQSMPVATLEEIRLLSNLETQQNKLLQIVLFGQPELDGIISQREIRQLKERITYSFQLNPFNAGDIRNYLNARLRTCGYRSGEIFDVRSTRLIKRYSAGLVRRINILADKSMLAAYAANANSVNAGHVRQAARDSEFVSSWRQRYWLPILVVALLGVVSVAVSWQINRGRLAGDIAGTGSKLDSPAALEPVAPAAALPGSRFWPTAGREATSLSPLPAPTRRRVRVEARVNATADKGSERAPEPRQGHGLTGPDRRETGVGVADSSGAAQVTPGSIVKNSVPAETNKGITQQGSQPDSQQLGQDGIFGPGDTGTELQILREQLKRLPPEVAFQLKPSSDGDACKLCWSIIYRPLIKHGKL